MASAKGKSKLRGDAVQPSPWALLIIDMINDFEFKHGDKLSRAALAAAPKIKELITQVARKKIPIIYANDNFDRWKSNFKEVISYCSQADARAAKICEMLHPQHEDYFILKPKHSAFFQTPLEALLNDLKTKNVIIAGLTADQCVSFTAADARMREYEVFIVEECVISTTPVIKRNAIFHLKNSVKATVLPLRKVKGVLK